jgi:3-oxoacyl-[acyl-carrier protein] reductase
MKVRVRTLVLVPLAAAKKERYVQPKMQIDAKVLPQIRGKRILITGAGRGVGREIAQILSLHKAEIVLADVNAANLQQTVELCKALGTPVLHSLVYDAGDISTTRQQYNSDSYRMANEAVRLLNGLDKVIIQHTLPQYHPILIESNPQAISLKSHQHMMVNYMGYVDVAMACLPYLIETSPTSSITYVSSLAASIPVPNCAQYAASKAGIESFFDCLALELQQSQIHLSINKVVFSMVTTPVLIEAMTNSGNSSSLSHGVSPVQAAWAVVRASTSTNTSTTHVPSSSSILISLYSILPYLVRFLVDKIGKTTVLNTPRTTASFLSKYFT